MPMSAIDATELMAKKQKQPDISKHRYVFSWKRIRSLSTFNISPADIRSAYILADEGADDEETSSDTQDSDYYTSDSEDETLDADSDS